LKARKPPINVGVLSSRRELERINVGVLDLAVKGKKRNIYQEFGIRKYERKWGDEGRE
jgi:hypothetical protein